MPNGDWKRATLASLSFDPDFSGLATFPPLRSKNGQELIRWLDRGGLSLVLLRRLQQFEVTPTMSAEWCHALAERSAHNRDRMRDMLEEFARVNDAFRAHGVTAATLKGFSLAPDFCEDLSLRHQTDLDFLIDEDSVAAAAEALQNCGYSTSRLNKIGESCFVTPLRHIPSADDDLYATQRHRQVDLHTSIWENSPWLHIDVPPDCLAQTRSHTVEGVAFLGLSLADKFILQVLHVFKHSFRSWIRPSWLLEIGRCLELHQHDAPLWALFIERAGSTQSMKRVFAFVLELVTRLFQTPIPDPLKSWTSGTTNRAVHAWLDAFAVDWAVSDWPGSLKNLFLAAEFIPERKLRIQYCKTRLFPTISHASLGAVATAGRNMFFRLQTARLRYVAHRAAIHLRDIASLPAQHLRWRRAFFMSSEDVGNRDS